LTPWKPRRAGKDACAPVDELQSVCSGLRSRPFSDTITFSLVMEIYFQLITDAEGIRKTCRELAGERYIGFDTETTELDPYRGDLRLRRRIHHHHAARRACDTRRERDTLPCVSGAHGPDAVAKVSRRQLADEVLRAPYLEGANRLQRLELEEDARTRNSARRGGWHVERHERRANDRVVNSPSGSVDVAQRNVAHANPKS